MVSRIVDPLLEIAHGEYRDRLTHCLYEFVKDAFTLLEPSTDFEDGPHIRAVCDHIQIQLEERSDALTRKRGGTVTGQWLAWIPWTKPSDTMRGQNLLVRLPPRCLKTIIASICAHAWGWLRWPELRIASISSNDNVITKASDQFRNLITSDWYRSTFQPRWEVRYDRDNLHITANTAGGERTAKTFHARVTGQGSDWRTIDDPHDALDVFSKPKREAVHNKWKNALKNRVNDARYSITTVVMQPLHVDDFGQRRLAENWPNLSIRMEYEARDASTKSCYGWADWRIDPGEVMHERFTPAWVADQKRESFVWSAQYQLDPKPLTGGIIKLENLRYYTILPTMDRMVVTVDAAFKKTQHGSRVSVCVIGSRGPDRYLIDNDTRPMHLEDTINSIDAMLIRYPDARNRILIEDKANGSEIIRRLKERLTGVIAINPGNNSKESRFMSVTGVFEGGNFWIDRNASYRESVEYELTQFPDCQHNDQVDAIVQALIDLKLSARSARALLACVK